MVLVEFEYCPEIEVVKKGTMMAKMADRELESILTAQNEERWKRPF